MQCDILTIFPAAITPYLKSSILGRAQQKGILDIRVVDLRFFAAGRHHQVDDTPYGGGPGMVFKPEPIFRAVKTLTAEYPVPRQKIILPSPQGRLFTQDTARELAQEEYLLFICGRYEGIDERVAMSLITDELSIGDYVLTGGELPALVMIDAITRLLPDALGDKTSAQADSFSDGLLDYPHYTRPPEFSGLRAPEVLMSGHHDNIRRWRRYQALQRTWKRRPDLLEKACLSEEDKQMLNEIMKK